MTDTEHLSYVFDEYKYRHDLVWRLLFRFTFAIVLLSYIPYADFVDSIKNGTFKFILLILPVIAVVVAGFSILVVYKELDHFFRIAQLYHLLQNKFLESNEFVPDEKRGRFKFVIKEEKFKDPFVSLSLIYLSVLLVLAFLNFLLVICYLYSLVSG